MAMPIVPWIGGKRRLADILIPRFPPHTCYVEVFAGAAALFFLRPPAEVEVLNDVNDDLVNLYRVVQHHPEEFIRQFKWALSSRQVFKWLSDTPPETLTDIQRASRFYYSSRTALAGASKGAASVRRRLLRRASTYCVLRRRCQPRIFVCRTRTLKNSTGRSP